MNDNNLNQARELLIDVIRRHELISFYGTWSEEDRISLLAYVAFALGFRTDNFSINRLKDRLFWYGYNCRRDR